MSVKNLWVMAGVGKREGTLEKPPVKEPGKKGGPERIEREKKAYPAIEPPEPWPEPIRPEGPERREKK